MIYSLEIVSNDKIVSYIPSISGREIYLNGVEISSLKIRNLELHPYVYKKVLYTGMEERGDFIFFNFEIDGEPNHIFAKIRKLYKISDIASIISEN